ncbi:hypothetical protein BDU57DRAFT_513970 [Ampelomyces quisqualis]|uniref:Uncharacterized protein n=1 Tax=Ampelomyces quisqualis TaxID=50730 RepID=A0A6A5QQI5_AMPQU|nr:hypothetical protein BDU57DRAFT_513970 [Ampelomyces quisqualis]
MPHAVTREASPREAVLLNHALDITPIESPLFPFPNQSKVGPTSYVPYMTMPYGHCVAEWQAKLYGLQIEDLLYQTQPFIEPIRADAPTLIAIFYPDDEPENTTRRPVEIYLERIKRLAALNEQVIIYAPPSISTLIRSLRGDKHWHVIDDFESIWDMPNNMHQKHNFTHIQPQLFAAFDRKPGVLGWEPENCYNHPHRSAVYNAKAYVTYDAVLRNPFGSEQWMYVDAGVFGEYGPRDADGGYWTEILGHQLSVQKFDRSISLSRDTGVVIGEYMQSLAYGIKDINHAAWTDPKKSWMCQHFIAGNWVGSSIGMLNYAVRFMQTVDDMDANGMYTAREEFVIPQVMIRYPNTIFSIPWKEMEWGKWEHLIKGAYLTYGGEESVPTIGDPIEGVICRGYRQRRGHLHGSGMYSWPWLKRKDVYGARYY